MLPRTLPIWRWALWALLLGILVLNVYRAGTQSLTVDEAFTYNSFVAPPANEAFDNYDANNHVLNTVLCRLSVWIFGVSELTLRLPSLFGGAVYLLALLWLSQWLFGDGWRSIVSFVALAANPIVLDYLSAARGYSLGLGFEFLGVVLVLIRLSGDRPLQTRFLNGAIGVALALSAAGNLVFVIPNLVLLLVFLILLGGSPSGLRRVCEINGVTEPRPGGSDSTSGANSTFGVALPAGRGSVFVRSYMPSTFASCTRPAMVEIAVSGLAVFGALMYIPLSHADASSFYVGEASFSRSAWILLVRSFNYPSVFWARHLEFPIAIVTAPAILGSLLLLGIVIASRKNPWPENRWRAMLVFPATLTGSLAVLVVLHLRFGFPFPYERTGLYFIPLITLTILVAAETGIKLRPLRIPGILLYACLCLAVAQYIAELKVNCYQEWKSDAGTKRVVALLASMNKTPESQKRIGLSWELEPSVSYYLKVFHVDWLQPVARVDLRAGGFDYYYLTPDDKPLIVALKLSVLYVDPVGRSVLAAPSSH